MNVPPRVGKVVYLRFSTIPGTVISITTKYGYYKRFVIRWQDGTESTHTIKELRLTPHGTTTKEIGVRRPRKR